MTIEPPDKPAQAPAATPPKVDPFDPLPPISAPASQESRQNQPKEAKPKQESKAMNGCLLAFLILLGAFLLLFGTCMLAIR